MATRVGFQKILNDVFSLKHELKTNHDQIKSDPAKYSHFRDKLHHCKAEFKQIQAVQVPSNELSKTVQNKLESLHKKLELSMPAEVGQQMSNREKNPLQLLIDIGDQFKSHQSREAFENFFKFETLYPQHANLVLDRLWCLKGSVQNHNPNYKRDLFYNAEGLFSLDSEKAESLLCGVKPPVDRLHTIQQLFEQNQVSEAFKQFEDFSRVYPKVADCIYGKVWEVYGRPDFPDFGKVAFYNTHPSPHFKVDWKKNGEAIGLIEKELEKFFADNKFMTEQNRQRIDQRCVEVVHENIALSKKGKYISPSGQEIDLSPYLQFCMNHSRIYRDAGVAHPRMPRFAQTQFEVRAQNCVEMAYDLAYQGGNILLLNLACDEHFGGAYLYAWGTQEEEITRAMLLAFALDKKELKMQPQDFYPIHQKAGPAGGIYSPQVPIPRMGIKNDYQFYEVPMFIAVATFAGFYKPPLDLSDPSNPRLKGEELKWTREKVRTIYQMAYDNGQDTLILGVLGCGVFGNPPKHVMELFMDVYHTEFQNCFKYVGFAVLEDLNDHGRGAHNPEGNFKPTAQLVQQNGGKAYNSKGELLSQL